MNWNLIHKYLANECSDKERDTVNRWIQKDPRHKIFMDSLEKIWRVSPHDEINVDARLAWDQFKDRIIDKQQNKEIENDNQTEDYRGIKGMAKRYRRSVAYTAAAIFILFFVTLYFANQMDFSNDLPAEPAMQEILTEKGERTDIRLNDGTKVILNSESTLRIPSDYAEKNRTIYLTGEAFFEVEHDESKPFLVHSNNMIAEDLGTKFNVRSFTEESKVEVVVTEGEVSVTKSNSFKQKPVLLSPNQKAVVSTGAAIEVQRVTKLSTYIGWAEGKLVFDETPFKEVMERLESWYNVECIAENKALLNQKLTATFEDEPLSNVITLISKSMDIEVNKEDRKIIFSNS